MKNSMKDLVNFERDILKGSIKSNHSNWKSKMITFDLEMDEVIICILLAKFIGDLQFLLTT